MVAYSHAHIARGDKKMRAVGKLPHLPWLGPLCAHALSDGHCTNLARALALRDSPSAKPIVCTRRASVLLLLLVISLLSLHELAASGSLRALFDSEGATGTTKRSGVQQMRRMQSLTAGMLSVGALTGVCAAQDAVQWKVEDGGNGHWYAGAVVSSKGASWDVARSHAVTRGGDLATIPSAACATWLFANIVSDTALWNNLLGPWVGGTQVENAIEPSGGWVWVDGNQIGQELWSTGQPDDAVGCGGNNNRMGYWNAGQGVPQSYLEDSPNAPSFECGGLFGPRTSAVIEWSADCNSDGIIDYGQCRDGTLADFDSNNIPDCCESGLSCVAGTFPVEWRVADGGNGHWYQGVGTASGIGWASAQVACVSAGGSLVSIGIAAESSWLYETIAWRVNLWSNSGPFIVGPWIGARGASGNWRWDDGTPWNYSAWSPGEGPPSGDPREQFAHFFNGVGPVVPNNSWGDYFDEPFNHSYIIEWSADCNNDGIIDYGQILSGALSDFNSDGVPDACQCDADIDSNSEVDGIDLAIILDTWGTNGGKLYPAADINHSGLVDGADLAQVLNSWGPCP